MTHSSNHRFYTCACKPRAPVATLAACLALAAALAACDSLAPPDHLGEALFSMSGNVRIDNDVEGGSLRPAVAFYVPDDGEFHMLDAEVEGEFPSDFTMQLHQPPPAAAFRGGDSIESAPGEELASHAMGYITAVTPELPAIVVLPPNVYHVRVGCDPVGRPDGSCETLEVWCDLESPLAFPDWDECYRERSDCPSTDSPPSDCELTSTEGDPSQRPVGTFSHFAGLAEDYVLLYLPEPITGVEAWNIIPGMAAQSRGYHLVSMRELTESELEEGNSCRQQATAHAMDRYNSEHGTDHTPLSFYGSATCTTTELFECLSGFLADVLLDVFPVTVDNTALDRKFRIHEEFTTSARQYVVEMGCTMGDTVPVIMSADEVQNIALRIGPDVRPLF